MSSQPFLIIAVDAPHLNYANATDFIHTVAKHPRSKSKCGDVGHAWIYLQGELNGEVICIEGGQSGETGELQSKYFDGIMNYIDFGYANPKPYDIPRHEANPVKYLWETQQDGYFQCGSGGHTATYAIILELSTQQFVEILKLYNEYPFYEYSITQNQCCTFVCRAAHIAGLDLESHICLPINQTITIAGKTYRLWEDPCYSVLPVFTPDILERSMIQAVYEGKAEDALKLYSKIHRKCLRCRFKNLLDTIVRFPERYARYRYITS